MIRSLSGRVISIDGDTIVIDVSGFGIETFATASLISRSSIGERIECLAYMQVSDSGISMFGFDDEIERALFLEITKVPGIGGRKAIALLRLDASTIASAIIAEDAGRLVVPGIGRALAEKICANLRTKIEKKFASLTSGAPSAPKRGSVDSEVCAGLIGLGFSQGEAARAAAAARADDPDREWTEETLMMAALNRLRS